MEKTASYWIEKLSLEPHPEGGYYREVYRSDELIPREGLPDRYDGSRAFVTSIYFLLPRGKVSRLHRLQSDELWYFFTGADIRLHIIHEEGCYRSVMLGRGYGSEFQTAVERGCWFGATVEGDAPYSLMGCVVAPGFDFNDFQMGEQEQLLQKYPQHHDIIMRLT